MLTFLLLILLLTLAVTGLLVLMIKKYYWGPDGRPPQYRPYGRGRSGRPDDPEPPEQR